VIQEHIVRTIYDIGSNNGSDIPYYILKADKVVAVEANPDLCEYISNKYSREVQSGVLVVENCAVTDGHSGSIDFYIHKTNHVLSSLIAPNTHAPSYNQDEWELRKVTATPIVDIIKKHGQPYYIKVDIEGHDEAILNSLVKAGIKPPFISAESHTIGVFALLSEQFNYNSFKLLDGFTVNKVYSKRKIFSHIHGTNIEYSFPFHSAGPFGNDIDGPWLNKSTLLKLIALQELGWKDIHATTITEPKTFRSEAMLGTILNYIATNIISLEAQARSNSKISPARLCWLIWLYLSKYYVDKVFKKIRVLAGQS